MGFAKWGRREIKIVTAVTCTSAASIGFCALFYGLRSGFWWVAFFWAPVLLLGVVGLRFFRDPERRAPEGERLVVAPADGRVVEVDEPVEDEFVGKARRMAIFMSLFNVHVNRAPVSGEVAHMRARAGAYHNAASRAAAVENAAHDLGLKTRWGPVLVRQVAGVVARHIICDTQIGQHLRRGERFGMIKYGSRLEVWVPEGAKFRWRVRVGDRTKAGETVIGEFLDEGKE